ncbi:hypothetical protein, partial [Enterococcus faecium]|uniref:hypothetical protein n=1 Tax=Enterococcus faecium TaxID=1352 RepID=UPI0034E94945
PLAGLLTACTTGSDGADHAGLAQDCSDSPIRIAVPAGETDLGKSCKAIPIRHSDNITATEFTRQFQIRRAGGVISYAVASGHTMLLPRSLAVIA